METDFSLHKPPHELHPLSRRTSQTRIQCILSVSCQSSIISEASCVDHQARLGMRCTDCTDSSQPAEGVHLSYIDQSGWDLKPLWCSTPRRAPRGILASNTPCVLEECYGASNTTSYTDLLGPQTESDEQHPSYNGTSCCLRFRRHLQCRCILPLAMDQITTD